jgi:hypothetical protein
VGFFFFGDNEVRNLTTLTPSLPLAVALLELPIVTRGGGIFDDATSYK